MQNLSDGYSSFFTRLYFCFIALFGNFYMLKLLLAVINSNLIKIIQLEAQEDVTFKRSIVEREKQRRILEEK